MSKPLIKPQTLKGFRDYLPGPMIAREHLIDTARRVYRSFGFSPIDTPALEYTEILLGKGGEETDKQLFRFTDQGERDVAMRFDLTVPVGPLRRRSTCRRSAPPSSGITSRPSGGPRSRKRGATASSSSAISTRSAPTRTWPTPRRCS